MVRFYKGILKSPKKVTYKGGFFDYFNGMALKSSSGEKSLDEFIRGKSVHTIALFDHFISEYRQMGKISVHPAKTMIGIATARKRIAYITQLGKNFIHVVFPFEKPYPDNLCFQKIANVPGDEKQHNHHLRILDKDDINEEVRRYMRLAYQLGS
jgi:hypothetical protein